MEIVKMFLLFLVRHVFTVQYSCGRYSDSLELYKRALQVNPLCPAAVRLGIGMCRYKLGQHEKAKQTFQCVLQLDPENVEALVALGILGLQINEAAGIRRGMEKMQRAFELYPYCSTSLNYLANHFFFTGQHFLVEQLTEVALAVSNHGPTKSHSYYNLARSYHSKEQWKSSTHASKCKDRLQAEDEDGGHGDKRRRKGGKRRKRERRSHVMRQRKQVTWMIRKEWKM